MSKIKLVKKKTNEMSGTGGSASATPGTGAQYASPKAFPRVASDYNKTFGTHFAPSIPNRPSKAITYKELWEAGEYDSLAGILKQLGAEEDAVKVLIKAVQMGALKPSDAIVITKKALGLREGIKRDQKVKIINGQYAGNIAIVHDFDSEKDSASGEDWVDVLIGSKKEKKTVKASELKPLKENTDDADFDSAATGAQGLQSINPLEPSTLKEARYTEFKKMTQVRTPGEQLHRAIREIRRKIDEINKLVSYTEKMKTEMKADVNEVRYLNRTKEALAKISARIQETNNKIKRLVQ